MRRTTQAIPSGNSLLMFLALMVSLALSMSHGRRFHFQREQAQFLYRKGFMSEEADSLLAGHFAVPTVSCDAMTPTDLRNAGVLSTPSLSFHSPISHTRIASSGR